MNEPVTTIDPRFSDPDTVATPWEQTRRVLETAELFWIATVRADGRPHVTPLVAVWLDGAIYFCTGDAEQKAVNLRGNPHVILTAGSTHWNAGLDVVVEGDAVQVTDEDLLTRLASAWTTKWCQGRRNYEPIENWPPWENELQRTKFHTCRSTNADQIAPGSGDPIAD